MDGRIIINFVHSYLLKHSCKIVKVIWTIMKETFNYNMDGSTSSTVGHFLFDVTVACTIKWICKYWIQQVLPHANLNFIYIWITAFQVRITSTLIF